MEVNEGIVISNSESGASSNCSEHTQFHVHPSFDAKYMNTNYANRVYPCHKFLAKGQVLRHSPAFN